MTEPGGTVVYSTCTFAPEENEAVLDYVLGETACEIVDYDLPLDHAPGITEWQDETFDPSVADANRIYASQRHGRVLLCETGGTRGMSDQSTEFTRLPETDEEREDPERATREEVLDFWTERFGVPPETFEGYTFWERGAGKLWLYQGVRHRLSTSRALE